MAELLVSVRSVAEAAAAIDGGAAVIDVKEPANGSLGRASDEAVAAVVRFVAGRRPVSAALGELREEPAPRGGAGLDFVKWGLAGCGDNPAWGGRLSAAAAQLRRATPQCQMVAVAYADWQRARAPEPAAVLDFVRGQGWQTVLIDTWGKNGQTLLDWMPLEEVARLCRRCRAAGVRVALAGSLGLAEIGRLRAAAPDWFAVRSAACRGGQRGQAVCPQRVRHLARLIRGAAGVPSGTSGGS